MLSIIKNRARATTTPAPIRGSAPGRSDRAELPGPVLT